MGCKNVCKVELYSLGVPGKDHNSFDDNYFAFYGMFGEFTSRDDASAFSHVGKTPRELGRYVVDGTFNGCDGFKFEVPEHIPNLYYDSYPNMHGRADNIVAVPYKDLLDGKELKLTQGSVLEIRVRGLNEDEQREFRDGIRSKILEPASKR